MIAVAELQTVFLDVSHVVPAGAKYLITKENHYFFVLISIDTLKLSSSMAALT
jgi:hypothetical protein